MDSKEHMSTLIQLLQEKNKSLEEEISRLRHENQRLSQTNRKSPRKKTDSQDKSNTEKHLNTKSSSSTTIEKKKPKESRSSSKNNHPTGKTDKDSGGKSAEKSDHVCQNWCIFREKCRNGPQCKHRHPEDGMPWPDMKLMCKNCLKKPNLSRKVPNGPCSCPPYEEMCPSGKDLKVPLSRAAEELSSVED